MILNLCNEYEVVTVIYIAKMVIKLACYVMPLILIISLMIEFIKVIVDNKYELNKALATASKKIIASIIIVLLPFLVETVISLTSENNAFLYCLNNATLENISIKKQEKDAARLMDVEKIEEERKKLAEEEEARRKARQEEDPGDPTGTIKDREPILEVDTVYIKTSDFSVPLYSCSGAVTQMLEVNAKIGDEMHSILSGVANYVNSNPFIGNFHTCGAYVPKTLDSGEPSRHAYGLAIDLFTKWTYTDPTTKKIYTPYSGQGKITWGNYNKFICEVCNGQENCKYNINYVIFYRYFHDNGWCWGGNWGPDSFDPMHYEIPSVGYCWTSKKAQINCN